MTIIEKAEARIRAEALVAKTKGRAESALAEARRAKSAADSAKSYADEATEVAVAAAYAYCDAVDALESVW